MEDRIRYKPGPRCIHVPVSITPLLVGKETLRKNEVQMILSARHRNIEEAPFFLDLVYTARAEV